MEFIVDESGCKILCESMQEKMKKLEGLINEIEDKDGTLKAALGDDYDAIALAVKTMTAQLEAAKGELHLITNYMEDYLQRVHNVHVILG